jgi:hypothetical protein
MYYSVAQELLFSTMTLIFAEDLELGHGKLLTTRIWQILDHIISNAQFASIIRNVRVMTVESTIITFELSES